MCVGTQLYIQLTMSQCYGHIGDIDSGASVSYCKTVVMTRTSWHSFLDAVLKVCFLIFLATGWPCVRKTWKSLGICKWWMKSEKWEKSGIMCACWWCVTMCRVASFEISDGKFMEIDYNLSRNFRKIVNYLCQSAVSKFSTAEWCYIISTFLTNHSPHLCALTSSITLKKIISFSMTFRHISECE